jgi:hypothetical protein
MIKVAYAKSEKWLDTQCSIYVKKAKRISGEGILLGKE